MTLSLFNHLSAEVQMAYAYREGTFLATRWEGEHEAVNLYHLPGGLFAELYYDTQANQIQRVRAFTSATPLEDYAVSVRLPNWVPEAD